MKKNVFIVLLIVIFTLLPLNGEDASNMKSFGVETIKVKSTDITTIFNLSGKVVVNREFVIKSPNAGVIARVHVIDGEWVTKGEKIITFNKEQINKVIKQNLNDIKKWEKILKQRQNWKVREKSAEDNAKKNIKDHKADLEINREFLK
ncbi:MAG: efflux RND transporter periplasmic adaptor subunit, partial [Candidatus Aminicenantes bacterium]|nr:efflux RND transporter periplasmic adaptor subunit [Candidatus Aminicenantes bacterium]